jgi:hypothetical protein
MTNTPDRRPDHAVTRPEVQVHEPMRRLYINGTLIPTQSITLTVNLAPDVDAWWLVRDDIRYPGSR